MKIGYPCINRDLGCTANSTFRLRNYSEQRLAATISNNLNCLQRILEFNVANGLYFFRISSDLIPFASHPVCQFDWRNHFNKQLLQIGDFIQQHAFRISMHPDQFVLLNAPKIAIVENSLAELNWHCSLLDAMQLDVSAKVQIHVGGVYNDKQAALQRFIACYQSLPASIKRRLVIENDDRLFSLQDCLYIHKHTGVPIIFDNLHHECLHNDETLSSAMLAAAKTWQPDDGIPMVDYSSQQAHARTGKHAASLDVQHFAAYLQMTQELDFDIMLEIKDKEASALTAIAIAKTLRPIYTHPIKQSAIRS
jgi:UV DNA damage endonuclease